MRVGLLLTIASAVSIWLAPVCLTASPPGVSTSVRFTAQHEFLDSPDQLLYAGNPTLTDSVTLKARPTTVYRPRSPGLIQQARMRSLHLKESQAIDWERVEVVGPDIEDKHTISQLARITNNAYALPGQKRWLEIDEAWNRSFPFGWEDSSEGFRGHVFMSSDNSTVILSIKGTTLMMQGPTSKKDQYNDNLLFSCCCARVDFSWVFRTVCDCYSKHWRCDNQCLTDSLIEDSLFYSIGVRLVDDLRAMYPNANIWLTGHSLGGSLASLLGSTFGLPAVAFEAPGERLAASRLHLPLPPSNSASGLPDVPITHIYHNADPIPQGACTGSLSPCAQGGYALETRCHLGKSIVYDAVGKLKWKVDVTKHPIKEVIKGVIEADIYWEGWREVPLAREEVDCVDCYKWEFGDFKKDKGESIP